MLEPLIKYARNQGLEPEPGFQAKRVRWAAAFSGDGRFLEVNELWAQEDEGAVLPGFKLIASTFRLKD